MTLALLSLRLDKILSTPLEVRMTATTQAPAICASDVIGTDVNDQTGHKIGEVKDIVLDKQSNNIMFGVVAFDGFMTIGEKYHPVPWASLNYDEDSGGYIVGFSKEQLRSAPVDSLDELLKNGGTAYRDRVYDFYNAPRYWQ
jgi:sporulation protein YlmC with PRC-barrel domain